MKISTKLLATLCVSFLLQACGSASDTESKAEESSDSEINQLKAQPAEVSYSIIHSGYNPYVEGRYRNIKVFDNTSDYEQELGKYFHSYPATTDTPIDIDFSTSQVLLIDMGVQSNGGYSTKVSQVEEFDSYAKATVVYSHPGSGCFVTTALTQPYQFIEISTSKKLLVEEELQINNCN